MPSSHHPEQTKNRGMTWRSHLSHVRVSNSILIYMNRNHPLHRVRHKTKQ